MDKSTLMIAVHDIEALKRYFENRKEDSSQSIMIIIFMWHK